MAEPIAIGIDLGGTYIKSGVVEGGTGRILARFQVRTEAAKGREAVLNRLARVTRDALNSAEYAAATAAGARFAGVGIGSPGAIDPDRGYVHFMTESIPGWTGTDIRGHLTRAFDFPVNVDNDANVAAYGEYLFGAGRGSKGLICLTLGTGIGGGIVLDGRIFHGTNGFAGELGHMSVETEGRPCPCGSHGCLEAYASATAIARMAHEALEGGQESSMRQQYNGSPSSIEAKHVDEAAASGDPLAMRIIDRAGTMLGRGVASLVCAFNPDTIVLGGGAAAMGERILNPVLREMKDRVFFLPAADCRVTIAELGNDAGLIGAAGLVLREEQGRP